MVLVYTLPKIKLHSWLWVIYAELVIKVDLIRVVSVFVAAKVEVGLVGVWLTKFDEARTIRAGRVIAERAAKFLSRCDDTLIYCEAFFI